MKIGSAFTILYAPQRHKEFKQIITVLQYLQFLEDKNESIEIT